jgi:hypothetical protein
MDVIWGHLCEPGKPGCYHDEPPYEPIAQAPRASARGDVAVPDLLRALDPIVTAHAASGSPCGDPMGIEWWAETTRLSDLLDKPQDQWSPAARREVARLADLLAPAAGPGFGGAPAGSMPPCP